MPSPSLPPPLLPPYSAILLAVILYLLFSISLAEAVGRADDDSVNSCIPSAGSSPLPCPPFNTTPPPFPFSSSPGCGHPSFSIHCSSPHSFITINNVSFSLLEFDADSSSLIISPHHINTAAKPCPSTIYFPSIPSRSINLSGSPFRISDSSCSRLSVLKPCPPPSLPNCGLCPWQCSLIKHPIRLFDERSCGSTRKPGSEQRCQDDVLGYLENFLKLGIQIQWDEQHDVYFTECEECNSKNGVCGFNSSHPSKQFLCYGERVRYASPWIQHSSFGKVSALCTIFILAALFCFLAVAFFVFRNRTTTRPTDSEDPTTLFLHRHRCASHLPPVFTYDELETSTNRFDPKRKIGDGGFGSVYLAQLPDGRIVAVKYLHRQQQAAASEGGRGLSTKAFCNEILILSSLDHPNLVKLHGYCSDPRGLLLVYDYVPNGTLSEHLHSPKRKGSLSWNIRVDIALQVAMAIEYLHCSVDPPIVHRDITTTNIFVEKDMRVKVGDFGLSRLLVYPDPNSSGNSSSPSPGFVWTGPQGTPGYLDPDYHHSFRLTEKSDVYSFGVVLLELITGMKAVDLKREKQEMALVDMAISRIQLGLLQQVVDPAVAAAAEGEVMESVGSVAELAFRCVAADKDDRPDAREVVTELRRIWGWTRGVKMSHSSVMVVPES